jgi:pimeloyl-ACP methyl ester carboxylesterase
VSAGPLLPPGLRGSVVRRHLAIPGHGRSHARLAVAEIGPRDAPAWLIAPGAGSSAHVVAGMFAEPVTRTGARLVTYDLRGHGASSPARDRADHHLDVVAADLAAVARSITGDAEVVGGISLGGHAALRALGAGLIERRPTAVLACLPAFDGPVPSGQGVHAAIAGTVRTSGIDGLLAAARRAPAMPRWLRTAVLRDQARHDRASLAAALQALDGADAPTDAERRALGLPLAVVGWPDDPGHPFTVAQRWAATARPSALVAITMDELETGLHVLGRAGLDAVRRALGSPPSRWIGAR